MNDEALMTNDEIMTKHEARKTFASAFRHLVILHSFELRHSSFVIVTI
jgi:hypothetical protein